MSLKMPGDFKRGSLVGLVKTYNFWFLGFCLKKQHYGCKTSFPHSRFPIGLLASYCGTGVAFFWGVIIFHGLSLALRRLRIYMIKTLENMSGLVV